MTVDLKELLAQTKPGGTVTLPPGRITLREPLVLDKAVRLSGKKTTLVGGDGQAVIVVRARGVRLERLAVERKGTTPGHVVVVDSGRLEMVQVEVRGGKGEKAQKDNPDLGVGVWVHGRAQASLIGCVVEDNDATGIQIGDRGRAVISKTLVRRCFNGIEFADDAGGEAESCRCENNLVVGVAIAGRAKGSVRDCTTLGGQNGFLVKGTSQVVLEGNAAEKTIHSAFYAGESARVRLIRNKALASGVSGVYVDGTAAVTLAENEIRESESHGIWILDDARVDAEGNTCVDNKKAGLIYCGKSTGKARRNVCTGNGWSGFVAVKLSTVSFLENRAEANKEFGFVAAEASRPMFLRNQSRKNKMGGAWVRGTAAPKLEGNLCEENPIGLKVVEQARPVVRRNIFRMNENQGILVKDEARPVLERNEVVGNERSGIELWSAAVARANVCRENQYGIEVVGAAAPRLERNVCEKNEGGGIELTETTDGAKPRPVMVANVCRYNGDGDEDEVRAGWPELVRKLKSSPHRKLARPAWEPVTQPGEGKGAASKFGGVAALLPGEAWPACGICVKPMPLVVQLDLSTLPSDVRRRTGPGVLQFFCCPVDETSCFEQKKFYAARILPPRGWAVPKDAPKIDHPIPVRRITGWTPFGEMPKWIDLDDLNLKGVPEAVSKLGLQYFDGNDDLGVGPEASAHLGDKLGGWPCWINSPLRPKCKRCKRPMGDLFQVDSNDNVPWDWGDLGVGWIFQCEEHRDAVDFAWDCH